MSRRSFIEKGDPSSEVQVIISSDHISTQTQEPTPVEAASVNIGVEEISSLKQELHDYALQNEWYKAKSIYQEFPEMVRIPLTASGDTILHVAVSANNTNFVREFVNYEHVTKEDLELSNAHGHTAFCLAAITGNRDVFQIMIQKNENLPLIRGQDGMLAVHLAALIGYHEIVQDLCYENLLQKMDFKDIQRLFFMAINSSMYDVATNLVQKYTEPLVTARYGEENLTALHMLARKPSEENKHVSNHMIYDQLMVFDILWERAREILEYKDRLELITGPSIVLFDAVKSGKLDFVKSLLYMTPELLAIKDPKNGQNLLHIAVLFRQHSIFDFILKRWNANLIIRAVDKDRNNVLHFAACQIQEASLSLRPDIRMRRELEWFKEVEMGVPLELSTMRNKDGMTPNDMFHANHRKLLDEVKDTAKAVANSGMVVAALIVAVAFAAALTTPGDKTNAWFTVFILTNAIALLTSSLSIVSFLSIFTSSRFKESDFIVSLYPSLNIGKMFLFISVVTMVMAFAAATFLIFGHIDKWVAYVVAVLGILTIILFLEIHLSLFDSFYISSIYDHVSTKLLGMLASR